MKNLFLLSSISFSLAFSLGLVVEKNVPKSAAIGGIATISTLSSAFILDKKGINLATKNLKNEVNNLKEKINLLNTERNNLQKDINSQQNYKKELLQLIESKTQYKIAIEKEYNSIISEVKNLRQELISLDDQRVNLGNIVNDNENKNQELLQLIESKTQSKIAIENEVDNLKQVINSLNNELNNLKTIIDDNENKKQELLVLLERKTQEKNYIEQEYNLIIQRVNELKNEINSLNLERDNLQNKVNNLQNEKQQIDVLVEEQRNLKITIEQEYNVILEKIRKKEIDDFIEKNTLYSQNLNFEPKDFLSIYRYNVNTFRSQIPPNQWGSYWYKLGHGTNILSEPENLLTYFALYGSSHYYKISYLLDIFLSSNIIKSSSNINIEIIDYGCGQALGTTCFIDYLKQKNIQNIKINAITLIEPSKASLSRGILHINHLGFNLFSGNIKLINKGLQELNYNDLLTFNQNIKLHIFSNILDVTGFEIENLANTIKESQSGINYFLCVSPTDLNNRIQQFFTFWSNNGYSPQEIQLSSEDLYKETWKFKSDQFKPDKIHRVQKLFYVNLEKFIDF